MKRFLLPAILILVIAGLVLFIGYLLAGKQTMFNPSEIVTEKNSISVHTVVKEILPIGEYASLAYHYTSVVKDINTKDIKGWNIPFTTRKYIFTYDGVMKLGIDSSRIRVEEPETPANSIRINLPPIKILSHEIMENSIEVFEQSQTIFNSIKLADAFKVTAERKLEMENKVMTGSAVAEAQASLEQQFGILLRGLPGIKDTYKVEFAWKTEEELRSDQPAESQTE